jgi:hypothetical protein
MERDNYYLLLELPVDPPESNPDRITQAIKKKQGEWSRDKNRANKRLEAEANLRLIHEIKKVMADDALRAAEASAARTILREKDLKDKQKLDEAIEILCLNGKITEKELSLLAKRFKGFSEADIRKRIPKSVPIVKEEQPRPSVKPLDATISEAISRALKAVGKATLYDFLELARSSSLKSLQDSTNKKIAETRKFSDKHNPVVTASGELGGHCLNVFKTEEMRNSYEATLTRQRLAQLDDAIFIAGMDTHISPKEYDNLLQKGASTGLSKDDVREYIREFVKRKNWTLEMSTKLSVDSMQRCGACGVMNSPKAWKCFSCAYDLNIQCPKCKEDHASTIQICDQCGFSLRDMPNAIFLLRRGRLALADNEMALAKNLLSRAGVFWPDHPELVELMDKIRLQEKAVTEAARDLHSQINKEFFYGARKNLSELRRVDPSHPDLSYAKTIHQKIDNAEQWIKKAKAASSGDDRIEAYSAAISECKDCQQAIEGLAKSPPDPPASLKAHILGRSIALKWPLSKSKGDVVYRVVKKAETRPITDKDGELLGETAQGSIDDLKADAGQSYHYAVFSIRGSVVSHTAAFAGPIMRMGDIEDHHVIPGDSSVSVSWDAPKMAKEFQVYRKQGGIPSGEEDGELVPGVRRDGFTDKSLKNDTSYGYLILTVFRDSRGKKRFSQGVTLETTPTKPPQPLKDMDIERRDESIYVKWHPPPKGSVLLFRSNSHPPFSEGEIIPVSRFLELGREIPIRQKGNTRLPIDFQGKIYISPVTVYADTGTVGECKSITSVRDVDKLEDHIVSGRIFLEWEWPPGAREVVVAYGYDDYPQTPDEPGAITSRFTKEQYDEEAGFPIHKPEEKDHYFRIFVVASDGAKTVYSAGKSHRVRNAGYEEIFYDIVVSRTLLRKPKSAALRLRFSATEFLNIPEMLLVKRADRLPTYKSDGYVICSVKGRRVNGKKSISLAIPPKELNENCYARLFLADDGRSAKYRILSPNREKLRLF